MLLSSLMKIFAMIVAVSLFQGRAVSQANTCLANWFAGPKAENERVSELADQVANSFGLTISVTPVPCGYISKVQSFYSNGQQEGIPAGEYIIYDPVWLREVSGTNRVEAIFLLGHEYGHFLNRHFSNRANLTRKEMETEADRLAGCAVARLGGEWDEVDDLLDRLRAPQSELYPDRETSKAEA